MQKYYVRVNSSGTEFWHSDPECTILHRLDGPAQIWPNGDEEYWIDGVKYTKEEFLKKTAPVKELTVAEVEKLLGYQVKIIKE